MLLSILLSAFQAAFTATAPAPAAATAAPSASLAFEASSSKCPETMHWADGDRRPAVRRLDELPSGRLELTVLRAVGDCPEPVVLREGIGGNPDSPDNPNRAQPTRR